MAYEPEMTPGRALYEQWLWKRRVPPDDNWDHLPEEHQAAWDELATEKNERLYTAVKGLIHARSASHSLTEAMPVLDVGAVDLNVRAALGHLSNAIRDLEREVTRLMNGDDDDGG